MIVRSLALERIRWGLARRWGAPAVAAFAIVVTLGAPAAGRAGSPGVAPAAPPAAAPDRSSPRAAVLSYLVACRAGEWERAAEVLDLGGVRSDRRAEEGPRLARELKVVLDRTLWVDVDGLSPAPEGDPSDGLPPPRDRVGRITTKAGPVDVLVDRVTVQNGTPVWKISAATVARIPALYDEFGYGPLGQWLPAPFFEVRLLEIELWQWVGISVAVVLAWALSWLLAGSLFRLVRPLVARTATGLDDRLMEVTLGPARLLVGIAIFGAGILALGLSVPAHRFFMAVEKLLVFVAALWLLFRLVDVFSAWSSARLRARGQLALDTMLPVGRRVVKVVLGGLAGIALLQNIGINVTGLLAGLGVGGLAVALAAQKTVENLFGGITVIADQPVRVGDFCRFGDQIGTVEDIGLRSTRVRTLDRTVVTIPNAEFSQMQLENFAQRDRIWYHPRIGLRYETTPDQIRFILVEIRKLLYGHPRVDPDPARIRFVGFGAFSLDLDVFAYVRATDYGEFLEIAEDLNLRIMEIVERAGSSFAFPSQTLYLEKGEGLDTEKGRAAEEEVERWRQRNELLIPRFPPDEIHRLAGTLDYPARGSAMARSG